MIVERRQILFSRDALLEAARLYAGLPQQQDLPYGTIVAVSTSTAAGGAVLNVLVQQNGASQMRNIPLSGPKLMAALILLCRKRHVPLPRNAEKALTLEGGSLVLTLSCSVRTAGEQPCAGAA